MQIGREIVGFDRQRFTRMQRLVLALEFRHVIEQEVLQAKRWTGCVLQQEHVVREAVGVLLPPDEIGLRVELETPGEDVNPTHKIGQAIQDQRMDNGDGEQEDGRRRVGKGGRGFGDFGVVG